MEMKKGIPEYAHPYGNRLGFVSWHVLSADLPGQHTDEDQEEDGRGEQRPDETLGAVFLRHHDDLLVGDDVGQRGVLHQRDDLVAHGGQDALDDL